MATPSPPQGSKFITNIDYHNLNYLTSNSNCASSISSNDFDLTTGKPLNNMTANACVDNFFIKTVSDSLMESFNVNNSFVYQYPQVLEVDSMRDLEITNETVIDVVFILEGASMRNMVGYYFYDVDETGVKRLLDTDTENPVTGSYFRPTVIFPNVTSEVGDSTTLQRGNTRRLRGNLPSGNFANVHIGFFLICYGWYAFITETTINNDKILHSTLDFNIQYRNTEFQMVNDKIYSVYVKARSANDDELLLLAFEDVFMNGPGDLDYNDCVLGFVASDVNNIVDYDKFARLILEEVVGNHNNIIVIDDEGEYISLPNNVYNIDSTKNHVFERHILFPNNSDRDAFYNILVNMLTNYHLDLYVEECRIVVTYLFRPNDLQFSYNNGKKELYLIKAKFNKHKQAELNQYRELTQKRLYQTGTATDYVEQYKLYQQANPAEEIIHLTDLIDPPRKATSDPFRILGGGLMDCKNGKTQLPFANPYVYNVYKNVNTDNEGLTINVKMGDHPTGYKLGTKYFVRYVSFIVNAVEHVVIDLNTLDIYQVVSNILIPKVDISALNTTLTKIVVGNVLPGSDVIKGLVSVFRNNSSATFRIITVNDSMKFYCINFENVKNNPTMVFLHDDIMVNWSEQVNTTGGTYYKKQRLFLVDSLSTI